MPKKLPPKKAGVPEEPFRYASVCYNEEYDVLLVCRTKQQLAVAWRDMTTKKLNLGLVDEVDVQPFE